MNKTMNTTSKMSNGLAVEVSYLFHAYQKGIVVLVEKPNDEAIPQLVRGYQTKQLGRKLKAVDSNGYSFDVAPIAVVVHHNEDKENELYAVFSNKRVNVRRYIPFSKIVKITGADDDTMVRLHIDTVIEEKPQTEKKEEVHNG